MTTAADHAANIKADLDNYPDCTGLSVSTKALRALLTERTQLLAARKQDAMAVSIAQGEAAMWKARAEMLESALKAENPKMAAAFAAQQKGQQP